MDQRFAAPPGDQKRQIGADGGSERTGKDDSNENLQQGGHGGEINVDEDRSGPHDDERGGDGDDNGFDNDPDEDGHGPMRLHGIQNPSGNVGKHGETIYQILSMIFLMKARRIFHRAVFLGTVLSFFANGAAPGLWAGARPPAHPAEIGVESVTWIRNGVSQPIETYMLGGERYMSVDQLAQLSQSQLRWQSISEQACLSRTVGLVCFNWGRRQIYLNGERTRADVPIKFDKGQLYIPFRFVTSRDFAEFSAQDFYWNAHQKKLTQEEPTTITIPAVENLGDRYQLAIAVKKSVPYHLLEKTPNRIWIRFVRGQTEDGSQILEGDNVIRQIDIQQRRRSADVLISLGPKATGSDVYLDQGSGRLTVDVFHSEPAEEPPIQAPVAAEPNEEEPVEKRSVAADPGPKTSVASLPRVASKPVRVAPLPMVKPKPRALPGPANDAKIYTVVIDAGHGGMDPGAIGTRGTFEKDVNLRVAKELGKAFERNKNVRVILTRDRDEFLSLSDRTEIANKAKADIFVSIHCNSSLSVQSNGFEVYILSPEATDQAAEAVARIENSVVALEIKKGESSSKLSQLLASMAVYDYINESSKAAALVCRGIRKRTSIERASVKEANFHVLRGAQMPGILVELGYISHPFSELQLRSSRFTSGMAKGIADGILQYQQSLGGKRQSITNQSNKPVRKAQR